VWTFSVRDRVGYVTRLPDHTEASFAEAVNRDTVIKLIH
jgi:hypothetical protein